MWNPVMRNNCTNLQSSRDERQATALAMLRAFVAALTCRAGHSLGGVCGYFDAHIVTSGHGSVVHRVNASAHDHMGGDSLVVGCPPLALWVAGSSLVRVWSLDGGRGIDPGIEARNWVTGYSGGGQRFR